jgi:hypothetical protein
MRSVRQQQGLTAISTLALILVIGFLVLIVLKLAPVYLEYFNVAASVNSLKNEPDLGQKSKEDVYELLRRRFEINDVTRVKKDNVKITRSGSATTIAINYEARVPLLGNVDFLVSFVKNTTFP